MNEHIHPVMREALNVHLDDDVVGRMAENMAAMLFIVGGRRTLTEGLVVFGEQGGWYLTQKGQQVFLNVLERLPAVRDDYKEPTDLAKAGQE